MWSNRWPASQIWPAASSLAEMENNCSNSRCCLNTNTSLSPCHALMMWLWPAGAPLISLTTLLCPDPAGTAPGSLFQENSVMLLREEHECQVALPVSAINLPGCLCWAKGARLCELKFPLTPSAAPGVLTSWESTAKEEGQSILHYFFNWSIYYWLFFRPVFSPISVSAVWFLIPFSLCVY